LNLGRYAFSPLERGLHAAVEQEKHENRPFLSNAVDESQTVLLPVLVVEALKEHRVKQEQARMKMGDRWREYGLIFSNIYGGYLNPGRIWFLFKKLLLANDLPDVRFHDLRHGAATVLLAAKVDVKVVSELLGHSSVAITVDIYQSVLPEMQQEAVKKMDDLYGHS
jgi:integrase